MVSYIDFPPKRCSSCAVILFIMPAVVEMKVDHICFSSRLKKLDGRAANIRIGTALKRYDKWTAKDATFLVQDLRTYPFGFPSIGDEMPDGSQTVTYPPQVTEDLMEDLCEDETFGKRKASDNNQCNQGKRKYKQIDHSRITAGNKW